MTLTNSKSLWKPFNEIKISNDKKAREKWLSATSMDRKHYSTYL